MLYVSAGHTLPLSYSFNYHICFGVLVFIYVIIVITRMSATCYINTPCNPLLTSLEVWNGAQAGLESTFSIFTRCKPFLYIP